MRSHSMVSNFGGNHRAALERAHNESMVTGSVPLIGRVLRCAGLRREICLYRGRTVVLLRASVGLSVDNRQSETGAQLSHVAGQTFPQVPAS